MARSGTRWTKDRASAASGGIPTKARRAITRPSWIPNPTGHGESCRAQRLTETLEDQRLWGVDRHPHQPQCNPGLECAKQPGEFVKREGSGNSRPIGVYRL